MDSSQDNESIDHSTNELICWSTPEMKNNNTDNYSVDYINNPFDNLELIAANMDPFDLVHNQIPQRTDPPCGNILSPLWKPEVEELQKSILFTTDKCVIKVLELSHTEHINNNTIKCQSKDDNFAICMNKDFLNVSKENADVIKINDKTEMCKLALKPHHIETDIENISLSNEEEKNQIREQTRQKIDMFIEKEKEKYEKKNLEKSIFCISQCNLESSLNITENVINKKSCLNDNLNNYNITTSNIIDINDNDINESVFPNQEFLKSSFDLNSLSPEWMEDDFSDYDESFKEVQTVMNSSVTINEKSDYDMDDTLKILNSIGTLKSKPNEFKTDVKSMQNKNPLMKHIYNNDHFQESNNIKQSTPALNKISTFKIPSLGGSSTKSNNGLLWQPASKSIRSPITTLNDSRFFKGNSTNYKNNIEKLPKKTDFNSNKLSGLPIPKKSILRFKGKENVKHQ